MVAKVQGDCLSKEVGLMRLVVARNAFFSIALVAFMASICGLKLAAVGDLPIAGDLVSYPSASHLEGRNYQRAPVFTLGDFLEKKYQSDLDRYVSDLVPSRDEVILANSFLQECAIELSADLFGYRVYPTYFGSEHAYDKEGDAVVPIPKDLSGSRKTLCGQLATGVCDFAAENRDVPILFCLIEGLEYSEGNPLSSFVSYTPETQLIIDEMLANLAEYVDVVDLSIDSDDQRFDEYFKTDHHWDIDGAYASYSKILAALDPSLMPVVVEGEKEWDVPFYGSYARLGLRKTNNPDRIKDILYEESNISVLVNGSPSSMDAVRHGGLYDDGKCDPSVFANRYGEYFHTDSTFGLIEFRNESIDDGSSVLLIADSYSNPIERLFAESFETVYCVDVRYADLSAQEAVEKFRPDKVVFIESLNSCLSDSFINKI